MTLQFNEPHVADCNPAEICMLWRLYWMRCDALYLLGCGGFCQVQAWNTLCNIISMSSQRLSRNSLMIPETWTNNSRKKITLHQLHGERRVIKCLSEWEKRNLPWFLQNFKQPMEWTCWIQSKVFARAWNTASCQVCDCNRTSAQITKCLITASVSCD